MHLEGGYDCFESDPCGHCGGGVVPECDTGVRGLEQCGVGRKRCGPPGDGKPDHTQQTRQHGRPPLLEAVARTGRNLTEHEQGTSHVGDESCRG